MARKKDIHERRIHKIDIRFTTEEYNKILTEMENYGYLSISKYVRERLLKGRLTIKEQVVTDQDIKNQINRLSTEISRIGTNYNTTVKKYMAMCNAKKEDGSALINTRSTNYYINNLLDMTTKVKEYMEIIIKTITAKEES